MPTESGQARIFDRIQPGLASMGVADQASMAAARILADAESVARGKVDVAQKALVVAQTELDGVRALIRAAQGEGATRRTDDRLLDQLRGERAGAVINVSVPSGGANPKRCPSMAAHPEHTWRFPDSTRVWLCAGQGIQPVTGGRCMIPGNSADCTTKGCHAPHDYEGGHCHGRLRGATPSGTVTARVEPCDNEAPHDAHTHLVGELAVWCRGRACFTNTAGTGPCSGGCELPPTVCMQMDPHPGHDISVSWDLTRQGTNLRHCTGRVDPAQVAGK